MARLSAGPRPPDQAAFLPETVCPPPLVIVSGAIPPLPISPYPTGFVTTTLCFPNAARDCCCCIAMASKELKKFTREEVEKVCIAALVARGSPTLTSYFLTA